MRHKGLLALAIGLLVGGTVFVRVELAAINARGGEKIGVVVVNENLPAGSSILERHLGIRYVPSAWVDDRTVREKQRGELHGLSLSVSVNRGESLQWTDFEERDVRGGRDLAVAVPAGNRAMAIPVNNALSLGGLLRPGHRVDILGTFTGGKSMEGEKNTRTLLQNIPVLAVGNDMSGRPDDDRFSTVTLSVTLVQSEVLAFASSIGSLSLVLRGYTDLQLVNDIPEIEARDILRSPGAAEAGLSEKSPSERIEQLRVRK